MKRFKLKEQYKNYIIQIEMPLVGFYPFAASKITDDEGVRYWINKGYDYLFEEIEQVTIIEEEIKPITVINENKPKKKRGRPKGSKNKK